jgi:hypothetical protein
MVPRRLLLRHSLADICADNDRREASVSDSGEKKVLVVLDAVHALEEVLVQTYPNGKNHAVFAGIMIRSLEKRGFEIRKIEALK